MRDKAFVFIVWVRRLLMITGIVAIASGVVEGFFFNSFDKANFLILFGITCLMTRTGVI
jgi:hypothetical protein